MRSIVVLSAVAIGWLGLGAPTAEAAKGVKKKAKPATTIQHVTGIVTQVHRPAGKNGVASFTVTTAGSKKKGKPAAKGGKAGLQVHSFTVAPTTTFQVTHSGLSKSTHFSALAVGEHVTVTGDNGQAQKVSIQTHAIKKKVRHVRKRR